MRAISPNILKGKMAEGSSFGKQNSHGPVADVETTSEPSSKRCLSPSASDGIPPEKSPRLEIPSPGKEAPNEEEQHPDKNGTEKTLESRKEPETCLPVKAIARRKSWRRATLSRRSLSAICNPYKTLCSGISTSLSQEDRLGLLMESALNLSMDSLRNLLLDVPESSSESFEKQAKKLKKKSISLTQNISSQQLPPRTGDFKVRGVHLFRNTIDRIQAESHSWENLSEKHKILAEELEKKLAEKQKKVISLDHECVKLSSQYGLIRTKPDYSGLLAKRRSMLNAVATFVDTRCKFNRELQSVKEVSQLMVKEISGKLAAQAGFEDHSPKVILDLMMSRCTSNTTTKSH
ncbi:kinetochore-associated protein DSN1 homolog [Stigmatopora nigra]